MVVQKIQDANEGRLIRQFALQGEMQCLVIHQGMVYFHAVQQLDPISTQCPENANAVGCWRRYGWEDLLGIIHKVKCIPERGAWKTLQVAEKA